ncbi:hypothetical protein ACH4D4_04685 [Streptomyces pristinaespiralis]|uniref:hypothetical protein n=1 Tax=Streptomyces pristinaespiralis TaxID=38300 RepID=UPI00379D4AC6
MGVFKARLAPQALLEASWLADDAEREFRRLRPLTSDEDRQDFETAAGMFAAADKVLSTYPSRDYNPTGGA